MCYVLVNKAAEMPKKSVTKDAQWNAKTRTQNWNDQKAVSSILSAINSDEVLSQGMSSCGNLFFKFHNCCHVQDVNHFTLAPIYKMYLWFLLPYQSALTSQTFMFIILLFLILTSWVAALKGIVKRCTCSGVHSKVTTDISGQCVGSCLGAFKDVICLARFASVAQHIRGGNIEVLMCASVKCITCYIVSWMTGMLQLTWLRHSVEGHDDLQKYQVFSPC